MAGFTTVRNVGAGDFIDVGLRNAIDAGVAPGPAHAGRRTTRSARAAATATTPASRTCCFGTRVGHRRTASPPGRTSSATRSASQVKYGADVIKVCATGGVLSLGDAVDTPQLTQAEMDALVDEAHRLRKQTAAHAHGAERREGRDPRRHRLDRARLVPRRRGACA